MSSAPELSILVPVLNEATALSSFLAMLGRQRGVAFEVILIDGGSTDGTRELAAQFAVASPFPCRIIRGEKGRGRQLNAGVAQARGETLLFLHADCRFPEPQALRRGLDALGEAIALRCDGAVAGHFALRFDLSPQRYGLGYYYYECKARLGRAECIHGDQGFLLRRVFFEKAGPFDETVPLLEDTLLAETIRRQGEWLLLPAEIVTSARRFESEGLYERQLLNALIMNFAAVGWGEFFRLVPDIYQQQDRTRRLRLLPYLQLIRSQLRALPWRRRCDLWCRTGRYVRPQAWQLAFACDVRRNFRRGLAPGSGHYPLLAAFDRCYGLLTDHPPGRLAAALLVWIWFRLTLRRQQRCDRAAATESPVSRCGEGEER